MADFPRLPTEPVVVTHILLDARRDLTVCGGRWPGDIYQSNRFPRYLCPACSAEMAHLQAHEEFRRG